MSRSRETLFLKLVLALYAALHLAAPLTTDAASNDVQPGYESAGLPRAEFLAGDLRGYVGKKFWLRRPAQGQTAPELFCAAGDPPEGRKCPREKFSVPGQGQLTIEEVLIAQPDPGASWLRIRFESGKSGFVSLQDFVEHRYYEGRISATLYGIDYALANSGWFFDDYPPKILDRRRAQFAAANDPKLIQEKLEKERVTRLKLLYPGMTAQQVLNSTWGPPNSVTTTVQGWRRVEQWDYGRGLLLFFEDGRLVRVEPHRR